MQQKNKYYVGWRWSENQRVWWRFLLAPESSRMLAATVEVHGGDHWTDDYSERQFTYRPYLRLVCLFHWTVMLALPRAWTKAIGGNEYGFRYDLSCGFLSVYKGARTHDSWTDKSWHCHVPWQARRFHAHRWYDLEGKLVKEILGEARVFHVSYQEERAWVESDALPKQSYKIRDFDGEELFATCYVEERHWKMGKGWFRWLSWFVPDITHRVIDIAFSTETGHRKGSWKGGTIGHSIEMLPGESPAHAMIRYCSEHEMSFLEVSPTVYVRPPRPPADPDTQAACVAVKGTP